MSVLFETSLGDIVVDLETQLCPITCQNFLGLCKSYRYNFCAFFNVQKDFIAQAGDPTDTGEGGRSVFNQLSPDSPVYSASPTFAPEIRIPKLKHTARGTLSMAVAGEGDARGCASQFFLTLADDIDFLDGKHAVFGHTVEGLDTLDKINEAFVDKQSRPMRDIRIRHVIVLDDPFPELPGLDIPPQSPVPTPAQLKTLYIGEDEVLDDGADEEATEAARRDRDARAQALTLEMVGDLPFADVRPPENVLFVCKLNRVTRSEDLELIFSRFGTILSCEVIRDQKTGDSLNYAFIEFDKQEEAERAYAKMDNVLIDDRRIHVDFSQSVSKLHGQWVYQRTGGRAPLSTKVAPNNAYADPSERRDRGVHLAEQDTRGYGMVFDAAESRMPPPQQQRRRSRSPKRGDRYQNGRDQDRDGRGGDRYERRGHAHDAGDRRRYDDRRRDRY